MAVRSCVWKKHTTNSISRVSVTDNSDVIPEATAFCFSVVPRGGVSGHENSKNTPHADVKQGSLRPHISVTQNRNLEIWWVRSKINNTWLKVSTV